MQITQVIFSGACAVFALIAVLSLVSSNDEPAFVIETDGARALFNFRDAQWDAVFGGISIRQLNESFSSMNNLVADLQRQVDEANADAAAARVALEAFVMLQAVGSPLFATADPCRPRTHSKICCCRT